MSTKEDQREAYYWLKARGLCTMCRCAKAEPGKTKCAACRVKYNAWQITRRERLKAKGLCDRCGREIPEPGRAICQKCSAVAAESMRRRRAMKETEVRT
ncbi:MAG: hypothetical protein IJJ23_03510 [Clostridia bacterium]|nr:hypothetical protein [Clostridia bacterium]